MKPRISVVIPLFNKTLNMRSIRQMIPPATESTEIIVIVDPEQKKNISPVSSNEQIIYVKNRGRGYNLAEGVKKAEGDIILFLHSDTCLPTSWDTAIVRAISNQKIVGGAFSLSFDHKNMYLEFIIIVTNLLIRLIKSFSGDRAMFIRGPVIKKNLSVLQVPIMEDAELSKLMAKTGDVVLLKEKVVTSAKSFIENGFLQQTWAIFLCSVWYAVGRDLEKIYRYYYRK